MKLFSSHSSVIIYISIFFTYRSASSVASTLLHTMEQLQEETADVGGHLKKDQLKQNNTKEEAKENSNEKEQEVESNKPLRKRSHKLLPQRTMAVLDQTVDPSIEASIDDPVIPVTNVHIASKKKSMEPSEKVKEKGKKSNVNETVKQNDGKHKVTPEKGAAEKKPKMKESNSPVKSLRPQREALAPLTNR